MDPVCSSGSNSDFDIDLESGGTTSEEDTTKSLSCESSENLLTRIRSGFISSELLHESKKGVDSSNSYGKFRTSDEISATKEEQLEKFREEIINYVKTIDKERPKKHGSAKPPRPPKGPLLDASDMKLLKEISELNLKRKRMGRTRTLKKIKKEKTSSLSSNLIALLVTIIFFLVIIFQGNIFDVCILDHLLFMAKFIHMLVTC
ncbi:UNVERIFIED_CONTAM: hypothetical protein Slati_0802300 [Sesamum latifolium]|uniref:Transmembrane protein n=1 Tax=Sesamum latifolium TaxID=2727402 RepID=A0AAW2XQS9_9LAMI